MADDLPPPPPGASVPVPPSRVARPPVPGWMWAVSFLGLIPVGALIGVSMQPATRLVDGAMIGGMVGLILGGPLCGGLALAARFYSGVASRLFGAILFGFLILVGLAAVGFAGCMCVMMNSNVIHR